MRHPNIKRVTAEAKALYEAEPGAHAFPWEKLTDAQRHEWKVKAAAAIAAKGGY